MIVEETRIEDLLRRNAPQVLGALVRRYGHFDAAEDAAQEALLAAARQWPETGTPDNPRGWLIRVAARRLTDQLRADEARARREETAVRLEPREARAAPSDDDTLTLLFLCCDPVLTPAARVALTLRAVGGLTTAEIARAHLVPEATIAQRISRAKRKLKDRPFTPGAWRGAASDRHGDEHGDEHEDPQGDRLPAVLHVLYLIFNEGYTATSGPALHRADLAAEAIRLTREVRRLLPREGAVTGLLALMLLTEARSPARTGPDGELIPLDEQDRTRWDAAAIAEGTALVEEALTEGPPGPYQLQAAVAALHDEAARPQDTDWPQILALYDVLVADSPDPMAELGRTVAVAMVHGPEAGLRDLAVLEPRLRGHHRLEAVRAHLLERAGDPEAARAAYTAAARLTLSVPERHYLRTKAARLAQGE
ncbi:RNA polymerase sigma factor [Streptomyces sp. NPDC054861]